VDATHGVALGTSFSSPIVAGIVALMLQHDRTLTQDSILAALQGGAHRLRGPAPFDDQAGAGEVDAMGALAAVDAIDAPQRTPSALAVQAPVRADSWMTLGADEYLADGTTPIEAVLQLRAPSATAGAPPVLADGFDPGRLVAYALVDGVAAPAVMAAPVRRGPGVWLVRGQPVGGQGASVLTIGVTFDRTDIVEPRSIPIATDTWSAVYAPRLQGGCSLAALPVQARSRPVQGGWLSAGVMLSWLVLGRRASAQRRRRRCSR
jgi:subtilisin family serine protease